MLLRAKKYAMKAHEGDIYGEGFPYTKHLNDVYNVLVTFGVFKEQLLVVAWLHDTIEDTMVVYEDIEDEFGTMIANLTYLLTDKRGRNRKERQEKTYPELAKDHYARLVKLADRIANMTMTMHDSQEKFGMYDKEYPYFKETLKAEMKETDEFHEIELDMWTHLDQLFEVGPFIEY
jgi:(p)ppGpp synthase/HD superfamily hydrolase